jgi:hypothetical protein
VGRLAPWVAAHRVGSGGCAIGTRHQRGQQKVEYAALESLVFFNSSRRGSPSSGRYHAIGAAVICAIVTGSAILALASLKSLEVTSAIAEEPVAPIPEPPPAASLKIAIGNVCSQIRACQEAVREAVPRVTTSARMAQQEHPGHRFGWFSPSPQYQHCLQRHAQLQIQLGGRIPHARVTGPRLVAKPPDHGRQDRRRG